MDLRICPDDSPFAYPVPVSTNAPLPIQAQDEQLPLQCHPFPDSFKCDFWYEKGLGGDMMVSPEASWWHIVCGWEFHPVNKHSPAH